jgi:LAGLIDADG DNA endonuclease family/Cytochrome C oxidase subunit II, transmembrane domain
MKYNLKDDRFISKGYNESYCYEELYHYNKKIVSIKSNSIFELGSGGYDESDCYCGGCCTCGSTYLKRADIPLAWGLYFQDGASPSFEGIVDLHNRIMFYLVVILFGVSWIMLSIMWNFNQSRNKLVYRYLNHGTLIELVWTVGPALVLVAIAFPSFKLLYLMDEVIDPAMTVKITGLFGQKLYILYKIINAYILGEKNLNNNYLREFHTIILRAKNRIGPHNQDVISVLIGSLLGDGYCNKRLIEGSRIYFRQSYKHKDYLFWLYDFFYTRGYCSNSKPRIYTRKLKNSDNIYTGYEFNTYTFRSLDWIYKLFYHKGKKVINKNIEKYITPLSLAIWIMDEGGWVGQGVRISTNAFTYSEIEWLTHILYMKFGLVTTIQKLTQVSKKDIDKYSIYIKSSSIPFLRKIVQPYIHCSMLYKIGL